MTASTSLAQQFHRAGVIFPPNVELRGSARNADGSAFSRERLHFLKWMIAPVAQATQEIVLPNPSQFTVKSRTVSPKTIISFSGMPNASARTVKAGEIEIQMGMLFAFHALPCTTSTIYGHLQKGEMSFDSLERFRPPRETQIEIDNLVQAWRTSARNGWRESIFPKSAGKHDDAPSHSPFAMAYLVVGHELTHWLKTIYKRSEWERMMKETDKHLATWLTEEEAIDRQALEQLRRALKDNTIRDNWRREIHADYGAFQYLHASDTHGGRHQSPEILMDAYVHMSLYFGLLALLEYALAKPGGGVDISTHPPAEVRRALFCHMEAKKIGLSAGEFMFRQFGAGTVVAFLLEKIFGEYASTH